MEDEEIASFAARLEASATSDEAVIKLIQHGGGPDESHVQANRAGYLRWAALFLRAATAPLEKDSDIVDLNFDLFHEDSDVVFAWLERRENFEPSQYEIKRALVDRLSAVGCVLIMLGILIVFLAGISTIIQWLASGFSRV